MPTVYDMIFTCGIVVVVPAVILADARDLTMAED